ncbi:MAG: NAD(P)-dependent alcohol dehydrogenase [Desulfobacteraceae bacterium]|nr:NAD(P)-dependent alcohol dehydrogenase [Desulfobacteraceae bacterium]
MTFQTRAAVVHHPGGPFVFERVVLDAPRPDEVLVRIVACGICHTDLAARDGLFGMKFPAVFGHEGAGIVEATGTAVSRVRPGDRVVISFSSCGRCSNCRKGHPAHCAFFDELNFGDERMDGTPTLWTASGEPAGGRFFGQSSLAFHALAHERSLIPVGEIDDNELALYATLGCGIQAGAGTVWNELRPRANEAVAVFGAGTVGLAAVMAARMAGAAPIAAVDIVPSRLELAEELGATIVVNAAKEDAGERLGEIAGGFACAVETTGRSRSIDTAVKILGPGGSLSLLAVSAGEEHISPQSPGPGQRVFNSVAGDSDPQVFIPFLIRCRREGNFPFHRLIREYPASEINTAVQDSLDGITIKPLLRF